MTGTVSILFIAIISLLMTEVVIGADIEMPWCIPPSGTSYESQMAKASDVVTFTWSFDFHDINIYQNEECDMDGSTFLAAKTGSTYTFTSDDVGEVIFACSVGTHCNQGQTVKFTVVAEDSMEEVEYSPVENNPCYTPPSDPDTSASNAMSFSVGSTILMALGLGLSLFTTFSS